MMHPARLFIVCGAPGAGKSARATELAERFAAIRMSAHDRMWQLGVDVRDQPTHVPMESIQRDLAADLLRVGTSVVVEWGTWARSQRDALRARAASTGAFTHLEFLDAPLDVLWDRISASAPGTVTGRPAITREEFDEWSAIVERPNDDELAAYEPMPPVRPGGSLRSAAFPYR